MSAEGILHVPGRAANSRLPVEPGLPQELFENPAIDVAAVIVANVDDQAVTVEDRVELTLPLRHVARLHRAQMDVAKFALSRLLDRQPPRVLPFVVSDRSLTGEADRCDDHVARGPTAGWRDAQ